MEVKLIETSDLPYLTQLQPPDWGDIKPFFTYFVNSPYCQPIKVVENEKIIGVGTTVRHADSAWLAMIIVHPGHRNKGLGKIITNHLIELLSDVETIYLIATPLGEPVYKKIGFELETEQTFYRGEITNFEISPNIITFDGSYTNALFEMDARISGENRQTRLNEHLPNAYLYITGGVIEGYYFPTLGEGIVIADTEQAGIALLKKRLQTNTVSILPVDNIAANNFLKENNFHPFRGAKRMRLGKKRDVAFAKVYNRASGQIG